MTREEAISIMNVIVHMLEPKYDTDRVEDAVDTAIKALEQEPKTGHWIEEDVFDGDVAYRCSECDELFWIESGTPKDNEYNFCPKCCKRLIDEQESEVRNE